MKTIILASRSPRRRKLLKQINLPFIVQPSSADEEYNKEDPPSSIVQQLSLRKALQVSSGQKESLIIGADTIVVLDNVILEKPADKKKARTMLSSLSGETHEVWTGVALVKQGTSEEQQTYTTFSICTKVTFGNIEPVEIDRYVDTLSPMDKAGGYGIQDDYGALFVERIEGDYNSVVGFPLFSFYQHLKSFAPEYVPLMHPGSHE